MTKRGRSPATDAAAEPAAEVPAFEHIAAALRGEGLVDTEAATKGRRAFGAGALKVRGKIFAMPAQGALVLKLPAARVEALVTEGRGQRFDPGHGRVTKEWIAMTGDAGDWLDLAREARAFVAGS